MSALTPQMDAALSADRAIVALLIEVILPGHALRLLSGSGAIAWGAKTFSGLDSVFGTLGGVDAIEDGTGDQAPAFSFSMVPPSNSSAAELASAGYQGSPVQTWLAAIHPTSGQLVPDPLLLFTGQLDQPRLTIGQNSRLVEFECVSDFDRLLEADEGATLSDAFHKSIWPGELGFANVTGAEQTVYWGTTDPNPTYVVPTGPFGSLWRDYAQP